MGHTPASDRSRTPSIGSSKRQELAGLATVKPSGRFARDFFARFAARTLHSFVVRTHPDCVGPNPRFVWIG